MSGSHYSSKFRLSRRAGMGLLMALSVLAISHTAFAQVGGGGSAKTYHPNPILMGLDYTVIAVLVLASLASIALIIDALIHIRASKILPVETTEHVRTLINARQFKDLMDFTSTDESFVSKSLYAAVRRAHLGYSAMRDGLESEVADQTSNLFRRVEMLNVIGNIGPLIGLLGTVLGMIMAFYALSFTGGHANVASLSTGIATALWHTFGGLAVAIPSLVAFGFFRNKIDKITARAAMLAEELLETLRPAEGKASPAAAASAESRTPAARPVPRRAGSDATREA